MSGADSTPGDSGFSPAQQNIIAGIVRGPNGYLPKSWSGLAFLFDGSLVPYAGVVPNNVTGVGVPGIVQKAYSYWQMQVQPGVVSWQRQATEDYTTTMLPIQTQMDKDAGRVASGSAEQPGGAGGAQPVNTPGGVAGSGSAVATITPVPGNSPLFTQGAVIQETFVPVPNISANLPPTNPINTLPGSMIAAAAGGAGPTTADAGAQDVALKKKHLLIGAGILLLLLFLMSQTKGQK